MEEWLVAFKSLRAQDALDIFLLTLGIYWVLRLIRGTRTIPTLMGISMLLGLYIVSSLLELDALVWVLNHLFSASVVIMVVLFQGEIRNALARVGLTALVREHHRSTHDKIIDKVATAASQMAQRKIGAAIVLERETGLRNYIDRGLRLNADLSSELLISVFHTSSPLHDGALIINAKGRVAAARCILPLSPSGGQRFLGTRHRSAMGISEETDALVVVVSEERREIRLVRNGHLSDKISEASLRLLLTEYMQMKPFIESDSKTWLPQSQTSPPKHQEKPPKSH